MPSKVYSYCVRFIGDTRGAMTIDSVVMTSGLVGLGLIILGSVGSGVDALTKDTSARIRLAVVSPGFDTSACPDDWQETHSANTGMSTEDLQIWLTQERRTTNDATLIATLAEHAAAPLDFRYREPMTLAHLQILMCLANERGVPLP